MPENLDLLDRKIMHELDLNARISTNRLSRKVRRKKETVAFRVRRLISEGYIKGFYTVFNTSKLGWFYYKLYLKFKNTTPKMEVEIIQYIKAQGRIAYLASMEGYYGCVFLVMSRNSNDLVDFLYPFMKRYGVYIQEKEIVTFLTTHRLNQKFLFKGNIARDWFYPVQVGNYQLDSTGKKILKVIASNARMPLVEIAKIAGVDPKVVKYRKRKLERDGIILAYVTSPNFERLGRQFVQVNISFSDPGKIRRAIAYFDSTCLCLFALEMVGKYDLAVELHVKSQEELRRAIDGFKEKFVGVYNDYDVSTITKEHVVVWAPFSWGK